MSSTTTQLLALYDPATLASILFLQSIKHIQTTGLLHKSSLVCSSSQISHFHTDLSSHVTSSEKAFPVILSLCPVLFFFILALIATLLYYFWFTYYLHYNNSRLIKVYSFVQCCILSKDPGNICRVNEFYMLKNLGLNIFRVRKDLRIRAVP